MKKSEVIEEVARVVKDTFLLSETEIAKAIVNKIEELGMMPPDTGKGPVVGTQWSSTSVDYSQRPDYRWENEDA